jgi:integrase
MADLLKRLTALQVNKLTTQGYHADGGGLYLAVSKTGAKSWIFRYDYEEKRHEMGLGGLAVVSLQDAREKADDFRKQLVAGKNPLDVKRASKRAAKHAEYLAQLEEARAATFDDCAKAYISAHRASWKNDKHISQWTNTLNDYASPVIGNLAVADVDTALVLKVLEPIWATKSVTAQRVRSRIELVLDYAKAKKLRDGDNPAVWKGCLEPLLARPKDRASVDHHPALPWSQIGKFMRSLRDQQGIAARAVELAILTAARSGEVRGAVWSEFDLDEGLWTIPASRMKGKKEHRVPLTDQAIKLLKAMPRSGDYVFHGAKENKTLSDMSLTAVIRRMNGNAPIWVDKAARTITVHGFRSTFRDWCAETSASSFGRDVAEHSLAHKLPDKIEAAYLRGDLLVRRTALMKAWADYCDISETPANVVPMNRSA